MYRIILTLLLIIFVSLQSQAQSLSRFADSVRSTYHIPELAFAVVSADSVLETGYFGVRRFGSDLAARSEDRFRIGSNTKAITSAIATHLIATRKITWETKFLDLYPELRAKCNPAFINITLLDLINMQVPFPSYTYTVKTPTRKQLNPKGTKTEAEERLSFVEWFLSHKPVEEKSRKYYLSNVSYSAIGLMLERASGRSYQELARDYGENFYAHFEFGNPARKDSTQTWGHTTNNIPEPISDDYKLNWLLPAGNINATLPDYVKFIQTQFRAMPGVLSIPGATGVNCKQFAGGWFWDLRPDHHVVYSNLGNPGSFTTTVHMIPSIDRAYIIFTNSQNEETYQGINALLEEMKRRYGY
jgi:CubicO group peptidase (beta-lactamase class C family)